MDQDQNTGGAPIQSSPFEGAARAGEKSSLMIIGVLVAVAVLALLAWYSMRGSMEVVEDHMVPTTMPSGGEMPMDTAAMPVPDAAVTALSAQGTSDEVADIDADLNATDLNSLDSSGI